MRPPLHPVGLPRTAWHSLHPDRPFNQARIEHLQVLWVRRYIRVMLVFKKSPSVSWTAHDTTGPWPPLQPPQTLPRVWLGSCLHPCALELGARLLLLSPAGFAGRLGCFVPVRVYFSRAHRLNGQGGPCAALGPSEAGCQGLQRAWGISREGFEGSGAKKSVVKCRLPPI